MRVTRKSKERQLSWSHNPIHRSINDDEALVEGLDILFFVTNSIRLHYLENRRVEEREMGFCQR